MIENPEPGGDLIAWAMRRALRLAARGRGWTSPNPMVGAVLLKNGRVIGEGYHTAVGLPHAEAAALEDCRRRGEDPAGATMAVNLEPCNHVGRTPPCTEAIISARVAKVVVAAEDPNPCVLGCGNQRLREAGIAVEYGLLQEEAIRLNEVFLRSSVAQRPFVALKAASTLDGKIATETGDSRWVSGDPARRYAYWLRHVYDAVLVGVETVIADDPQLTCRLPSDRPYRQPLRIVMDSHLRIPSEARLVSGELPGETVIATTDGVAEKSINRLAKPGVKVERFPAGPDGRILVRPLLDYLWKRGITGLLVEGGGQIHASFITAGLADKLQLILAPKVAGGKGPTWVAAALTSEMNGAPRIHEAKIRQLGRDFLVEGYFTEATDVHRPDCEYR